MIKSKNESFPFKTINPNLYKNKIEGEGEAEIKDDAHAVETGIEEETPEVKIVLRRTITIENKVY